MPAALLDRIEQPAVDLAAAAGAAPERSRLLACLLLELDRVLTQFAREGFAPFRDEWQDHDVYRGKAVRIALPDGGIVNGTAEGVAENGALLLATHSGQLRFHSGEVSMRAAA